MSQVPATTAESDALSKDLKKRGFSFVGSIVIYAHMQAAGLVNDHTTDCFRHPSNGKPRSSRKKTTQKVTSLLTQTERSQKSRASSGKKKTASHWISVLNASMIPLRQGMDFEYLLIDCGLEAFLRMMLSWICGFERWRLQPFCASGSTMKPIAGKILRIAMRQNWINSQKSYRNSEMLRVRVGWLWYTVPKIRKWTMRLRWKPIWIEKIVKSFPHNGIFLLPESHSHYFSY